MSLQFIFIYFIYFSHYRVPVTLAKRYRRDFQLKHIPKYYKVHDPDKPALMLTRCIIKSIIHIFYCSLICKNAHSLNLRRVMDGHHSSVLRNLLRAVRFPTP